MPITREDEELLSQSPPPHLSAGRGFYEEGKGKVNQEIKGRDSLCAGQASTVHSNKDIKIGQVMVWCVSSWSLSLWVYVMLVLWEQISYKWEG